METTPHPQDNDWIDCGKYWLNVHQQGSGGWLSARRRGWGPQILLTASNFGAASGHSIYKTPIVLYNEMMGLIPKEIPTERAAEHMARGTQWEPVARIIYENYKNVKVREVGLMIPKFDINIGSSLDGLVGEDGCIEIKCPEYVYHDLLVNPISIKPCHYDQMQGGMAISGTSWCDYVVYGVHERRIVINRIPFNKDYWEKELYPKLSIFTKALTGNK